MSIISMRAREDIRNAFKGKEKREREMWERIWRKEVARTSGLICSI
jgi:hypothetical protein